MSSKIGLLISLVFFSLFFLLAVDVICIEYHYSYLDNKSTVIAHEISHVEVISDDLILDLENKHHVIISNISSRTPTYGEVIDFTIIKEYKPIIVSNEVMIIKVNRSTIVGYY